jgi:hypothetical protein
MFSNHVYKIIILPTLVIRIPNLEIFLFCQHNSTGGGNLELRQTIDCVTNFFRNSVCTPAKLPCRRVVERIVIYLFVYQGCVIVLCRTERKIVAKAALRPRQPISRSSKDFVAKVYTTFCVQPENL